MAFSKWIKTPVENYCITIASVIYFYAFYYVFIFPLAVMAIACAVAGTFTLFSIVIDRKFGNTVLTSNYMIAVGYSLIAYSCFMIDGSSGSGMTYLALAPLIAGFTQTRYVLFWSLAAISLYVSIHFLDSHGLIDPIRLPQEVKLKMALTNSIGVTLILTIVTTVFIKHRKKQYDEINSKHQKIENLLRVISHDIANPLNLISFSISIASRRGLDDNLSSKIKRGVSTIQSVIEQTRIFQALENEKLALNLTRSINLKQQITSSLEIFEEPLAKKSIRVNLDAVDPTIEVYVDPQVFQTQILSNLISNAIKFSKTNDRIDFSTVTTVDSNKSEVILKITDHGVGMSKRTRDSLFDLKAKTSTPGTSGETGTGFGLPIVKRYIEQMDGRIEIDSSEETAESSKAGTVVSLSLRRAA